MFEDSVDAFIQRWHSFAVTVRIFPKTEGSPLLECRAGSVILSLLERTGPYGSVVGQAEVIVNATAAVVEQTEPAPEELEIPAVSRLRARGRVIVRDGQFLVVDVGIPIVLGVQGPLPAGAVEGATVRFDTLPPLHGFVVSLSPNVGPAVDEDQLV